MELNISDGNIRPGACTAHTQRVLWRAYSPITTRNWMGICIQLVPRVLLFLLFFLFLWSRELPNIFSGFPECCPHINSFWIWIMLHLTPWCHSVTRKNGNGKLILLPLCPDSELSPNVLHVIHSYYFNCWGYLFQSHLHFSHDPVLHTSWSSCATHFVLLCLVPW